MDADAPMCDASKVLRFCQSQPWGVPSESSSSSSSSSSHPSRKISLFFCEPPNAQNDADIHGALNALLLDQISCEFIYLSQIEASSLAAERLGELALLISGWLNCSLARIRLTHAQEDLMQVQTNWHMLSNPPQLGILTHLNSVLNFALVPLTRNWGHVGASSPETMQECTCHNLVVARPVRCAHTNRKPSTREIQGYHLGELDIKAEPTSKDDYSVTLKIVATVPSVSFDACVVLGSPEFLRASDSKSEEHFFALATLLTSRQQCLVVRKTSSFGSTFHMMASGNQNQLVLVRVAAQEDILIAPTLAEHPSLPSHAATASMTSLLESLPSPESYKPAAYRTRWTEALEKTLIQNKAGVSSVPANSQTNNGASASKKMFRLPVK